MLDAVAFSAADELPHPGLVDEWVFAAWVPDGSFGFVSGQRLFPDRSWYWSAVVEAGRRLLHLAEWQVAVRSDPFIIKAPEMWAEHQCDAPLEQWSVGNEAYFVALDEPSDALGNAYGSPTPVAIDAEWYATAPPTLFESGYSQGGVVHGEVEFLHRPNLEFNEAPARRWRRWGIGLGALATTPADAGPGMAAPFAFPDGTSTQWTLAPTGWQATTLS